MSLWATELKNAVITAIDPLTAAELAHTAALASEATVASLATAGAMTGTIYQGTTMTTATVNYAPTTSGILAGLGEKLATAILAGATVTTGLAVGGILPNTAQNVAADFAGQIGIEIPRADLGSVRELIDVGSAGTVSLQLDNGVLTVTDLAAFGQWTPAIQESTDNSLRVAFTDNGRTLVMEAVVDAKGQIQTTVHESATNVPDPEATGASGGAAVGGSVNGSASVTNGPVIDVESDIDIGVYGNAGN